MVHNGIGNLTRGGRKTSLSKSLKSGSVAQFLNTMTLCAIFFGMGLTKSLINLQVELERKAGPSPKETANSVGYVVGFVFGKTNKLYLCRHNKMFIMSPKHKSSSMFLLIIPF
jgi:hypothetical protein